MSQALCVVSEVLCSLAGCHVTVDPINCVDYLDLLCASPPFDHFHDGKGQNARCPHQYPILARQWDNLEDRRSGRNGQHGHLDTEREHEGKEQGSIRSEAHLK